VFAAAAESQLVRYNVKTKAKTNIGKPAIFENAEFSPNGKYLLVERVYRPFSFSVPHFYFSGDTQIWNAKGGLVYEITRGGPWENIPIQGVKTGPREAVWVSSQPQTLVWAEALDKGDWAVKADYRDELFTLKVADQGKQAPESMLKLKNRFNGIEFLDDMEIFWVSDYERDKEWITTSFVYKKDGKWSSREVFSLSENDDYKKPGEPAFTKNKYGKSVIIVDKRDPASIFLHGPGATPEGERPFLRRMDMASLKMTELFRSEKGSYEQFESFSGQGFTQVLTTYESQQTSPRVDMRVLKGDQLSREAVYADPNPYEIMAKIKKEIITYKRADGVLLSAVLYYPLNYQKGVKYPAVIQAYPLEYTDASVAGQVRGSQDRFEKPFREAVVYNALRGYVVLDDAQMPIIGHPETKNDTFIEQLVSGAKAAVDALKARDLIDPKRVGVIGHSYGAFMVAHLLTHSDLFAAGIAKSGAYNRTLTPFGFQGERRPFWKAKQTYIKLSPFFDAEQMKKPMLLMHGMADNNPGTFTLQTERYFDALKGQGATARMVLLPEEAHGYASIESIETVLAEIFNWYDKYLKNAETK
jgi:dipeptidyl aminopeptidase/acylaminoacyl peptidase